MKKIFTLCSLVVLSLFAIPTTAQINENFDNGLASLTSNCWQFSDMMYATSPSGLVINGNGTLYSEPPVSSDSVRQIIQTSSVIHLPMLLPGREEQRNFLMEPLPAPE